MRFRLHIYDDSSNFFERPLIRGRSLNHEHPFLTSIIFCFLGMKCCVLECNGFLSHYVMLTGLLGAGFHFPQRSKTVEWNTYFHHAGSRSHHAESQ